MVERAQTQILPLRPLLSLSQTSLPDSFPDSYPRTRHAASATCWGVLRGKVVAVDYATTAE